MFRFQGVLTKSRFQDDYSKIWDTKLGHIDLSTFLTLCNKSMERSPMIFSLIQSGLFNIASHPTLMQSLELIMTLAENYVSVERVMESITGEIILDLQPKNIDKVFHLLRVDQLI